jgi:C4-dicarboxylate-specific signal transduction histidine kinase
MNHKLNTAADTGLRFFGNISASISHELKNVLAIINENAGLLEDLALMADRGIPSNPERLILIATKVKNQISRGDGILKNLNRLAHSIDETFKSIELNEIIELFLALSDRFAAMRSVAIKAKYSEDPVRINTAPFFLMNLLWRCLDFAVGAAGDGKSVEIAVQKSADGPQIRFGRLEGLTETSRAAFPAEGDAGLLGLLGAEPSINIASRELVVTLAGDKEQRRA